MVTYEGLPNDWYQKLTGAATRDDPGIPADGPSSLAEDPRRVARSRRPMHETWLVRWIEASTGSHVIVEALLQSDRFVRAWQAG